MVDVTVAELAAALIACFEGCRYTAYKDGGGVWTIGIGHTKGITEGMTATPEMVAALFAEDAAPLLKLVAVAGRPALESAALVSFGFNCGTGPLMNVLAGRDSIDAPRHCTDKHGVIEPGLQNRRRLEELLVTLSQQLQPAP